MNLPRFAQSVRSCPCCRLARGGCVAVALVEISSAIYKGRFRNCSAGLYFRLHGEKKKKENEKKKVWEEDRANKGWPAMALHGEKAARCFTRVKRVLYNCSLLLKLCGTKTVRCFIRIITFVQFIGRQQFKRDRCLLKCPCCSFQRKANITAISQTEVLNCSVHTL